MSFFLIFGGIVVLLLLHAVWLAVFALDLFFETDRSTAAERARSIWRHLTYGIVLETSIGVLIVCLWLFR